MAESSCEHPETPAARAVRILGMRRVMRLCGISEDAVKKWERAVSRGGTGGLIPQVYQHRLLAEAEADGLDLTARDIIAEAIP